MPIFPLLFHETIKNIKVNSESAFVNATAQLRSPNGHDPTYIGWTNPIIWGKIDKALKTSETGAGAVDGNPENTIASLKKLGISPLAVAQIGCSTFSFSTMVPTAAAYWAERWEYYKIRYAVARWLWLRGVVEIEFWNEPDLSGNDVRR